MAGARRLCEREELRELYGRQNLGWLAQQHETELFLEGVLRGDRRRKIRKTVSWLVDGFHIEKSLLGVCVYSDEVVVAED